MKKDEVKKVADEEMDDVQIEEDKGKEKLKEDSKKKTEKKEKKAKKEKKDTIDRVLLVLMILFVLEVCMIPCFVYAGMNQIFPIVMFLVIPTLLALFVLLLSRNTLKESKKKKIASAKKKETEKE